ncbi:MAG TPA: uracil-DNA glycosylase [Phycisphaerales bacterium]|nr:uracil-DNA glycosylase [Phycisphaerales bacterium]
MAADPRLTKLVQQHAHTAKLMGVDFVPAYRVSADEPAHVVVVEPPPVTAPPPKAPIEDIRSAPVSRPPARVAITVPEQQPVTEPRAQPRGTMATWKRPAQQKNEDDREYKTRALAALLDKYTLDAPHECFKTDHHSIVWGDGDPAARLVFVGEAPGEEEDHAGKPFVGRSGQLLNKMITAMGLSRETVYICNVLKTRPPNNATPTSHEAALCEPYLMEQLAIIKPEAIVTLGLPATRTLLKTEDSMAKLRNNWRTLKLPDGSLIPVMPTYHPAYLLRAYNDENRMKVWSDLWHVVKKLGLKAVAKPPAGAEA